MAGVLAVVAFLLLAAAPGDAPLGSLLRDEAGLAEWLRARSPEVAAAAARVQQSKADLAAAGLFPNPTLDFSVSDVTLGATNPPGLGFNDTAIYSVGLAETIELGKRGPRTAAARLRAQSALEGLADVLAQRMADARAAAVRAAYLRARSDLVARDLAEARHLVELERTRFEHGDLPGRDLDRLLLETATLEVEAGRAEAELEAGEAACSAALAARCAELAPEQIDLAASAPAPAPGEFDAALALRPDLRALALDRESAEADAVTARRRALPDPNIRVGYTRDKLVISGDQPRTLMLTVTMPLPAFDRGQHDAARALSRAVELEAQLRAAKAKARADAQAQARRRVVLERAAEALRGSSLPRSEGVVTAAQRAFDLGGAPLSDLILARRVHAALALQMLDLRFELFTARNELRRALGLDAEAARHTEQR